MTSWTALVYRAAIGTVLFVGAILAHANIIDETYGEGAGSFELGTFAGGPFVALAPGSTTISGWTVGGANGIDWLIAPVYGSNEGVHAVDLQSQALTIGSISTAIPTIAGGLYRLSFAAAAVTAWINTTGVVSAGSLVNQQFTAPLSPNLSGQAFENFSYLFSATDSLTTITFRSIANPGSVYGPVIDSVSVSLIPEPGTFWMLLVSLAVLTIFRKAKLLHR